MHISKKFKQSGFTFIELLVVVSIIGILTAIIIANLQTARKKSRDASRVANALIIQESLERYFDANRSYPTALSDLVPNYLPVLPKDPLGAPGCSGLINCNYFYAYYPASSPTYYHLGITLEQFTESETTLLKDDKDCKSINAVPYCGPVGVTYASGYNGIDSSGCGGLIPERSCYDIVNK